MKTPLRSNYSTTQHHYGRIAFRQALSWLRNAIYELVLVSPAPIHIKTHHNSEIGRAVTRTGGDDSERLEPALLRTCKQIHQEATSILYHNNKFNFNNEHDDSATAFEEFTTFIGSKNADMLRTCFVEEGASQLVPMKYDDQHKKLESWGEKLLDLSASLPKCRIVGILNFKVDDTQDDKIECYQIDFSSPHDDFVSHVKGAADEALNRTHDIMEECGVPHHDDPQSMALSRLGIRMFNVCTALSKCLGDLGRYMLAIQKRKLAIRKLKLAIRKQKLKKVKQRRQGASRKQM